MVSESSLWYCCEMSTKLMNTDEVAEHLSITIQTLFRWRQKGYGPAWMRIGPRIIRHKMSDVVEWEDRLRDAEQV